MAGEKTDDAFVHLTELNPKLNRIHAEFYASLYLRVAKSDSPMVARK